MQNCFRFLVILVFFSITTPCAFSQEIEKHVTETSANENLGQAREEIIAKAIQKSTEDLIIQLIGKDSASKNAKTVQTILSKETARFVPSYKTSDLQTAAGESQMKVILKISLSQLKDVLTKYKLLQKSEGKSQIRILVKNTEGFVMTEALKNEILARFPEMNKIKERSLTNTSIEFIADIENETPFTESKNIQLMNRRAEVKPIKDQTLEIVIAAERSQD